MDSLGVGLCPPTQDLSGSPTGSTLSSDQEGGISSKGTHSGNSAMCPEGHIPTTTTNNIAAQAQLLRANHLLPISHPCSVTTEQKQRLDMTENICSKPG